MFVYRPCALLNEIDMKVGVLWLERVMPLVEKGSRYAPDANAAVTDSLIALSQQGDMTPKLLVRALMYGICVAKPTSAAGLPAPGGSGSASTLDGGAFAMTGAMYSIWDDEQVAPAPAIPAHAPTQLAVRQQLFRYISLVTHDAYASLIDFVAKLLREHADALRREALDGVLVAMGRLCELGLARAVDLLALALRNVRTGDFSATALALRASVFGMVRRHRALVEAQPQHADALAYALVRLASVEGPMPPSEDECAARAALAPSHAARLLDVARAAPALLASRIPCACDRQLAYLLDAVPAAHAARHIQWFVQRSVDTSRLGLSIAAFAIDLLRFLALADADDSNETHGDGARGGSECVSRAQLMSALLLALPDAREALAVLCDDALACDAARRRLRAAVALTPPHSPARASLAAALAACVAAKPARADVAPEVPAAPALAAVSAGAEAPAVAPAPAAASVTAAAAPEETTSAALAASMTSRSLSDAAWLTSILARAGRWADRLDLLAVLACCHPRTAPLRPAAAPLRELLLSQHPHLAAPWLVCLALAVYADALSTQDAEDCVRAAWPTDEALALPVQQLLDAEAAGEAAEACACVLHMLVLSRSRLLAGKPRCLQCICAAREPDTRGRLAALVGEAALAGRSLFGADAHELVTCISQTTHWAGTGPHQGFWLLLAADLAADTSDRLDEALALMAGRADCDGYALSQLLLFADLQGVRLRDSTSAALAALAGAAPSWLVPRLKRPRRL